MHCNHGIYSLTWVSMSEFKQLHKVLGRGEIYLHEGSFWVYLRRMWRSMHSIANTLIPKKYDSWRMRPNGFMENVGIVLLSITVLIIYENLCWRQFFSVRKAWVASIIYYVQLIGVITYMWTHKADGSHRSLLTLYSVNVFAVECITDQNSLCFCVKISAKNLSSNIWWCCCCMFQEFCSNFAALSLKELNSH